MKEHGAYTPDDARTYDRDREVEPLWHAENAYVADLVKQLGASTVLDVPVGTGRFLPFYAGAQVTGVDLSDAMLSIATARVAADGLRHITLQQGSVTDLPFADRAFQLVVCWRLLHLLPPLVLRAALAEMARVCNGTLCVQVYERAPQLERTTAWAKRWMRRFGLPFAGKSQLTPWSHITAYAHSRADIEAAAAASGLGSPLRRDDLGGYEGTRVVAITWARGR
jgi:ubiquinone/menaquinone biosynthesis C-methylase UbiE